MRDNRQQALQWFSAQQMGTFAIMDPMMRFAHYRFQGDDPAAADALAQAIALLPDGHYKIQAKSNPKASGKDAVIFDLYIANDSHDIEKTPAVAGPSIEDLRKEIRSELEREFKLQLEIERMKWQLENSPAEPAERVIGHLKDFMQTIMASHQPAQPTVIVGPPDKLDKGDKGAQKARLRAALKKLMQHDPHLIDHLELLAKLAEQDPGAYQMGIQFLKNSVK